MEPSSDHPSHELGFDLASTGTRVGARVIDSIIGVGVWLTVFFMVVAANDIDLTVETDITAQLSDGAALLVNWAPFLVWAAYEIFLTATRGQTVGKMVTRIKVINGADGEPPPWGPAVMRWAVLALPLALLPDILGLGGTMVVGFWFLWDANRQGLHDKSAKTFVVKSPLVSPAE